MHYENKEFPKQINHFVSLTAEDLKLAIKEAVKKEYPSVPNRPDIRFSKDVFGVINAAVEWVEIER